MVSMKTDPPKRNHDLYNMVKSQMSPQEMSEHHTRSSINNLDQLPLFENLVGIND